MLTLDLAIFLSIAFFIVAIAIRYRLILRRALGRALRRGFVYSWNGLIVFCIWVVGGMESVLDFLDRLFYGPDHAETGSDGESQNEVIREKA